MRGVLLADVGPDRDVLGADHSSESQQWAGVGFREDPLVGDGGIRESFSADELGAGGVCHRDRLAVGASQNLHPDRNIHGIDHGLRRQRHGGDDFGSDGSEQIREIVHVLDQNRVETGLDEHPCLTYCSGGDHLGGLGVPRRSGEGTKMHHADGRDA
jgi:hypothetical protein